jgi:hypothetical protein
MALTFSLIQVLQEARGLPNTEHYTVLTRKTTDLLIKELERLYAIEELCLEEMSKPDYEGADLVGFWSDFLKYHEEVVD